MPSIEDSWSCGMDAVDVAYDAKTEPHPLLMVREMKRTYTVEIALKKNQHSDVSDQGRSREIYGVSPGGMVGEGGLGTVDRQAVFVDS